MLLGLLRATLPNRTLVIMILPCGLKKGLECTLISVLPQEISLRGTILEAFVGVGRFERLRAICLQYACETSCIVRVKTLQVVRLSYCVQFSSLFGLPNRHLILKCDPSLECC